MKKLVGILMVISMFAFVACDSKKDKQEKEDTIEAADTVEEVDVDENVTEVEVAPVNNNGAATTTPTNPQDEVVAGQGKGTGTANPAVTTPVNTDDDAGKPTSNASGVNNENVQAGSGKGN